MPEDPKEQSKGPACPRCGCRELPVRNTKPTLMGKIKRYRECRHCGKKITTVETVIGANI